MKVSVTFAVLSASRVAATLVPKHRVQKRKNHRRVENKRQTTSIVDDEEQDNESPSPNLRKLDDMNWKRKAKSFERDIVRGALNSKDEIASDVGVLAVNAKDSRNLQENESTCPEDNVIVCEKGIATSIGGNPTPPGTSCKDACNGQCCVDGMVSKTNYTDCQFGSYYAPYLGFDEECYYDDDCVCELPYDEDCYNYGEEYYRCDIFGEYKVSVPACEGLTASICQDNVTCTGKDACTDAKVGTIHLGCNGFEACKEAGKGGYLGSINNGCEGRLACSRTGYGGNITMIQNSCRALNFFYGARACANAASNGGTINRIIDSCVSNKSEDRACEDAARDNGHIGEIFKSCNAEVSCQDAATGGFILSLDESCNTNDACKGAARFGYIGEMNTSCNNGLACGGLASSGYVNGLNDSCNGYRACQSVGQSSNKVQFTMDTCCNGNTTFNTDLFRNVGECEGLGGNNLPAECQILPPSTSPSPTSPAPSPDVTLAPTATSTPPKKRSKASKRDKGGNNGKGYGVGGDPKAVDDCSKIKNTKAKKKCLSKLKKAPWK